MVPKKPMKHEYMNVARSTSAMPMRAFPLPRAMIPARFLWKAPAGNASEAQNLTCAAGESDVNLGGVVDMSRG